MTLKEFTESFPDICKLYKSSFYSRKMDLKPIDRLIGFIESNHNIVLINIGDEESEKYRPCIRINGKDKKYDLLLPLHQSKSFLVSKALVYLNTGAIY